MSTRKLVRTDYKGTGSFRFMSLAANLKKFREEKELSQPKLAEASGVSQQLISQIERGVNNSTKNLPALAKALGVTVYDLDENYTPDDMPATRAPLVSWVSAGALSRDETPIDLASAKLVTGPDLDPRGKWIALRVEGTSMNKVSPPDSVIFVNLKDKRLVANACYIVETEDGHATYKRYRPTKPNWHPVTTEAEKHKPIPDKELAGLRVLGRVRFSILEM